MTPPLFFGAVLGSLLAASLIPEHMREVLYTRWYFATLAAIQIAGFYLMTRT